MTFVPLGLLIILIRFATMWITGSAWGNFVSCWFAWVATTDERVTPEK